MLEQFTVPQEGRKIRGEKSSSTLKTNNNMTTQHTFVHPEVLTIDNEEGFSEEFSGALRSDNIFDSMIDIINMSTYGVWSFKCFKKEFCEKLVKEIEAVEMNPSLRVNRPNSMNRYGIVLKDLGFGPLISVLFQRCIAILSQIIFGVSELPYYHAFTVRYQKGEDLDLKTHVDDSDITLNICLGKEFTGSKLYFQGYHNTVLQKIPANVQVNRRDNDITEVEHDVGTAFIHFGKHVHGARKIESGERVNLIIWCKKEPFKIS